MIIISDTVPGMNNFWGYSDHNPRIGRSLQYEWPQNSGIQPTERKTASMSLTISNNKNPKNAEVFIVFIHNSSRIPPNHKDMTNTQPSFRGLPKRRRGGSRVAGGFARLKPTELRCKTPLAFALWASCHQQNLGPGLLHGSSCRFCRQTPTNQQTNKFWAG